MDRHDIRRLLVLYLDEIDLERVRGLVREIATALDDPERIAAFDALTDRARSL